MLPEGADVVDFTRWVRCEIRSREGGVRLAHGRYLGCGEQLGYPKQKDGELVVRPLCCMRDESKENPVTPLRALYCTGPPRANKPPVHLITEAAKSGRLTERSPFFPRFIMASVWRAHGIPHGGHKLQ